MSRTVPQPPGIWEGQELHFTGLAFLLALTWGGWHAAGSPHPAPFWAAIAAPVAHQIFVWLAWRLQLRSQAVTKTIGFTAYLIIFFALLAARILSLFVLAWADSGSLPLPGVFRAGFAVAAGALWTYLGYSVARYFGFIRAAGADHFFPAYRTGPLIKQGIFRYTDNGMYTAGFLGLWIIAVWFQSKAALIAVAFNHAYIWVHFYAVEKPDLDYLYRR